MARQEISAIDGSLAANRLCSRLLITFIGFIGFIVDWRYLVLFGPIWSYLALCWAGLLALAKAAFAFDYLA